MNDSAGARKPQELRVSAKRFAYFAAKKAAIGSLAVGSQAIGALAVAILRSAR